MGRILLTWAGFLGQIRLVGQKRCAMRLIRLPVFAAVITLAALVVRAAPELALEPNRLKTFDKQVQLRDFVIEKYLAAINSIKSVEFDYALRLPTINGPGKPRLARYVRDGERFWHKHAADVMWDGKHAYRRIEKGLLYRSANLHYASPECPVPEHALNSQLERGYGIAQRDNSGHQGVYQMARGADLRPYAFLGAAEVQYEGRECVEMRFISRDEKFILTAHHARELDYWPVNIHVVRHDGLSGSEIADIRYHKKLEPDGSAVFFPMSFETRHWAPRGKTKGVYQIDEKTLRVNEKIDDARFKPSPDEKIVDFDTAVATTTQRADQ